MTRRQPPVGGICPLTPQEIRLRQAAAQDGFTGSFVGHVLISLIHPDELTRSGQLVRILLALAVNLAIYLWL